MKFSVSKDKLLEGLSTVQNVVSTRTTLPILSNVLLQASDGEIRLTTTDLDVGVRRSVEAQVERTGATTLPARRLFSIVRELPSSEICFDVDTKNCASIRSGSSYFKILGLPEEEFPPLARFEDAKIFTIAQKVLKDGLKKTSYAISTDETRYVLNGILFSFELNRTLLVSKLIEGNYPNYRQVIPSEAKERITLERETFLTAVRRVSILTSEKSNSVKLIFSKSNIDIVANTPEVGEAKESLPVMYNGREFSIAFNPEFLMAPLRNLSEEEIYLDLIDEMSPGVIKIAGPFLCVLMPMRF